MNDLRCTVIIPSFNRQETLRMVLNGLEGQTISPAFFEVIVVLDGSTDGSLAGLVDRQDMGRLPHLRVLWQANSGQAAARNAGARLANSPVLLFLDDDIVPAPDLIEIHLAHHSSGGKRVVLGDALVVREQKQSLYHLGVWGWWEDTYQHRAEKGRHAGCRDFCAGNVSLRKEDFLRCGGFDPGFRAYGGEDFELGWRLLKDGAVFIAERKARAFHYHRTTAAGVLHATRQEAAGDARLAELHPELRQGLRMSRIPPGRYRWLVLLALKAPRLGDVIVSGIVCLLPLLQRLQMRRRWQVLFNHARGYAYWRGVRDVFSSMRALSRFQEDVWAVPLPTSRLDLAEGLPSDLSEIWLEGPSRLQVTWGDQDLGEVSLEGPILGPLRPYIAAALVDQLGPRLWSKLGQSLPCSWDLPGGGAA